MTIHSPTGPALYFRQFDKESLSAAVHRWGRAFTPRKILALVAEADAEEVEKLQAWCRDTGIHIWGAVFPTLLVDGRFETRGFFLLPAGEDVSASLVQGVGAPENLDSLADIVADFVDQTLDRKDGALFCIFDALVPNIASHLDAWYLRLGDQVKYGGVNAGSESFKTIDCLFDTTRFVADAVLLLVMPDRDGVTLKHGYTLPDDLRLATSTDRNCVNQIDWRPAMEVYREMISHNYGVTADDSNFYSLAVHFPFGIIRADGELLVRIPVAVQPDGGIACVGEIPPNSVLTLLDARGSKTVSTDIVRELVQSTRWRPGVPLVTFYCAGRRMHKGTSADEELISLSQELAPSRVYGAVSLGEIGSAVDGGYPLFHNATIVLSP